MKFVVTKRLDLAFLGEGWQAAYIDFTLPSLKESLEMDLPTPAQAEADAQGTTKKMAEFIKGHFQKGEGYNGSQLAPLTEDDLMELPPIVLVEATKLLMGALDPKS